MERTKKAWINVIFFAITLVINTLGAFGIINGMSQKEVSDMYLTPITPSPSTFSIWSIIYLLLLASLVFMIIKKEDPYYNKAVDEITILFRISCILNIAWIVTFSYVQLGLSVIFIIGFLISLLLICRKVASLHNGNRWLLPLSFGIYTGWLVIATFVNIAASLVKINWNGFGFSEEFRAIVMLIVAVLVVILLLRRNKNAVLPLPVAWAYFGIYQQLNSGEGLEGKFMLLKIVALSGMVVLIGAAAIQLYLNKFKLLPYVSDSENR
ncbi:TspO and MBR related proteins [Hathewaya proteolytica DSM 3090]|uniref:TspO and MBR related proteins n=1 Tax=Hathewaya proteolytica DSM 3090 TaxID=1121331 RepID=A0A1M6M0H6_9CLOT|nr:TspO/MBR family protein [Hathewaya proteolytica]SHJ76999.1 TspO and MBR related proteins [Hathewaya proteolytica DSM 3090]